MPAAASEVCWSILIQHADGAPLVSVEPDRGWSVTHKTGTDLGVRADTGVVTGPAGSATYAVLAHWHPEHAADPIRDTVLDTMRAFGTELRAALS